MSLDYWFLFLCVNVQLFFFIIFLQERGSYAYDISIALEYLPNFPYPLSFPLFEAMWNDALYAGKIWIKGEMIIHNATVALLVQNKMENLNFYRLVGYYHVMYDVFMYFQRLEWFCYILSVVNGRFNYVKRSSKKATFFSLSLIMYKSKVFQIKPFQNSHKMHTSRHFGPV